MESNVTQLVEKGTYAGLVGAVLQQVAVGLADNAASNDAKDPSTHAAKKLRTLGDSTVGKQSTAQKTLAARFALGANDVMYLQNAVSVLAAGQSGDREVQIAPMEMLSDTVMESVKRVVHAEMEQTRMQKWRKAPHTLKELIPSIAWLLQLEEVRSFFTEPSTNELLIVDGDAYKITATIDAMNRVVESGDTEKLEAIFIGLYAMLSDDLPPGQLAEAIQNDSRASVRDFNGAKEMLKSKKLELDVKNVSTLREIADELRQKVETLGGQITELKSNKEEDDNRAAERERRVIELDAAYNLAQEQINTLTSEIAELMDEFRETKRKLTQAESASQDFAETIKTLQKQIANANAASSTFESEVSNLQLEIQHLQEEKARSEVTIETFQTALLEAGKKKEELEQNIDRQTQRIQELRGKIQKLELDLLIRDAVASDQYGNPLPESGIQTPSLSDTAAPTGNFPPGTAVGASVVTSDDRPKVQQISHRTVTPSPREELAEQIKEAALSYATYLMTLPESLSQSTSDSGAARDSFVQYSEYRGLVGQRGPVEPKREGDTLKYTTPWETNSTYNRTVFLEQDIDEHNRFSDIALSGRSKQRASELLGL